MDDELKAILERLQQQNATAHSETRRHFDVALDGARQENARALEENAKAHSETRRHFDVALDGALQETRLVAEGVADTREALTREANDIREELRRTAAETQAMFKFSHAELDRRVRTLEEGHSKLEDEVGSLKSRVDRLESTH